MEFQRVFSERFADAVKMNGISYAELSRKLGITKATVSMYKSGKAVPSIKILSEMCDILECSADFLLGRSDI